MLALSKDVTAIALDISEWMLLFCGALLTAGIIGEYAKSKWWLDRLRIWKLSVIFGVLVEMLSDGGIFLFSRRLQRLEGAEITQLGTRSSKAFNDANSAINMAQAASTVSADAKSDSKTAKDSSVKAVTNAGDARRLALEASISAREARREADSFARDIASAKRDAQEAKNLLAESRQLALEARKVAGVAATGIEELKTNRTVRLLLNFHFILSSLPAQGTHFQGYSLTKSRQIC